MPVYRSRVVRVVHVRAEAEPAPKPAPKPASGFFGDLVDLVSDAIDFVSKVLDVLAWILVFGGLLLVVAYFGLLFLVF